MPVPIELAVSAEAPLRHAARRVGHARDSPELHRSADDRNDHGGRGFGDAVPLQLRTSGRVLRARLTAKDEAVAIEDGQ